MARKPASNDQQPNLGALVNVEAIEPIRHDGEDVAPGQTVAVNAESAAILIASGAAKAAE